MSFVATSFLADRLAEGRAEFIRLASTIPDDSLGSLPAGFDKNAAWLVGHMRLADSFAGRILGAEVAPLPEIYPAFGPGSTATTDAATFGRLLGSRDAALEALRASHAMVVAAVRVLPDSKLASEMTDERARGFLGTYGRALTYFVWHEGWHAGQLSQWRRAMGLGGASAGA